mmetsp:Transcript_40497/g.79768  ORF Transcript_40497/g.79768 Transcript_40497/m.79768 type:complete len:303 (+) Transcript_40497:186-1094(+)
MAVYDERGTHVNLFRSVIFRLVAIAVHVEGLYVLGARGKSVACSPAVARGGLVHHDRAVLAEEGDNEDTHLVARDGGQKFCFELELKAQRVAVSRSRRRSLRRDGFDTTHRVLVGAIAEPVGHLVLVLRELSSRVETELAFNLANQLRPHHFFVEPLRPLVPKPYHLCFAPKHCHGRAGEQLAPVVEVPRRLAVEVLLLLGRCAAPTAPRAREAHASVEPLQRHRKLRFFLQLLPLHDGAAPRVLGLELLGLDEEHVHRVVEQVVLELELVQVSVQSVAVVPHQVQAHVVNLLREVLLGQKR